MNKERLRLENNMVLPEWVLEHLRCPRSGGKLFVASQSVINGLVQLSRDAKLMNVMGRTISQVPSQGLVSENGMWFYPVDEGVACLLADEAIEMTA